MDSQKVVAFINMNNVNGSGLIEFMKGKKCVIDTKILHKLVWANMFNKKYLNLFDYDQEAYVIWFTDYIMGSEFSFVFVDHYQKKKNLLLEFYEMLEMKNVDFADIWKYAKDMYMTAKKIVFLMKVEMEENIDIKLHVLASKILDHSCTFHRSWTYNSYDAHRAIPRTNYIKKFINSCLEVGFSIENIIKFFMEIEMNSHDIGIIIGYLLNHRVILDDKTLIKVTTNTQNLIRYTHVIKIIERIEFTENALLHICLNKKSFDNYDRLIDSLFTEDSAKKNRSIIKKSIEESYTIKFTDNFYLINFFLGFAKNIPIGYNYKSEGLTIQQTKIVLKFRHMFKNAKFTDIVNFAQKNDIGVDMFCLINAIKNDNIKLLDDIYDYGFDWKSLKYPSISKHLVVEQIKNREITFEQYSKCLLKFEIEEKN